MKPALLATLALALATPAAASPPWRPTSTTAVSITGKVTLSPEHLIAAGADFPLRLVGASPTLPYSHARPAMVFAVTRAMNPILLNGNRMCGPTAPAWIVAVPIDPNGLEIAVFAGPRTPTGPDSPGLCATFFYNR
jgi:hypothetical protein